MRSMKIFETNNNKNVIEFIDFIDVKEVGKIPGKV